ncbi:MAG TPA: hypothetical protein VFB45_10445 [Pseudolabrys sp.]|nr:hypothetical protein [Pseudolabrys sp.]
MKLATKSLLTAAAGAAVLAFGASSASAAIACSGNVCWHTHEHFAYPRESRVIIHPDTWRLTRHYTIREHEGRGYWRGDSWVDF